MKQKHEQNINKHEQTLKNMKNMKNMSKHTSITKHEQT